LPGVALPIVVLPIVVLPVAALPLGVFDDAGVVFFFAAFFDDLAFCGAIEWFGTGDVVVGSSPGLGCKWAFAWLLGGTVPCATAAVA